jgi:hypothetical protein
VTSGATRLTWTRKREGTTAWWESAERSEGVEGVAVQGPRDMAKAIPLEAQTPAMKGTSPDTTPDVGAAGIGRLRFFVSTLPAGGRQATILFKGTEGRLHHARYVQRKGNSGWPTGREPHGHGVSVVVVGVTTGQGVRESRSTGRRDTGVNRSTGTGRYARCETPKPYWRSFTTLESRVQLTLHARFGKGPSEKDPSHGHLVGGLLHGQPGSEGGHPDKDLPESGTSLRGRPYPDPATRAARHR